MKIKTYVLMGDLKYLGTCDVCKTVGLRTFVAQHRQESNLFKFIDICPECYHRQELADADATEMETVL